MWQGGGQRRFSENGEMVEFYISNIAKIVNMEKFLRNLWTCRKSEESGYVWFINGTALTKSHFLSFYWAKTARAIFCTYPIIMSWNVTMLNWKIFRVLSNHPNVIKWWVLWENEHVQGPKQGCPISYHWWKCCQVYQTESWVISMKHGRISGYFRYQIYDST